MIGGFIFVFRRPYLGCTYLDYNLLDGTRTSLVRERMLKSSTRLLVFVVAA